MFNATDATGAAREIPVNCNIEIKESTKYLSRKYTVILRDEGDKEIRKFKRLSKKEVLNLIKDLKNENKLASVETKQESPSKVFKKSLAVKENRTNKFVKTGFFQLEGINVAVNILREGKISLSNVKSAFQLGTRFPRRFNFQKIYQSAPKSFKRTLVNLELRRACHIFSLNTLIGEKASIAQSWVNDANQRYLKSKEAKKIVHEGDKELLSSMSNFAVDCGYDYPGKTKNFNKLIDKMMGQLEVDKPVSISTGWAGHGINVTVYRDLLILTNKGPLHKEGEECTIVYRIGDDKNLREVLSHLILHRMTPDHRRYIYDTMARELSLSKIIGIQKAPQKAGNCAFANNKAGLENGAFALEFKRQEREGKSQDECIAAAKTYSHKVFKSAEMMDRQHEMEMLVFIKKLMDQGEIVDPKTRQYYQEILLGLSDKFAKNLSEDKLWRIRPLLTEEEDFPTEKYGQYAAQFYAGTSAKERGENIKNILLSLINQSSLEDIAIVDSNEARAKTGLKNKHPGAFVVLASGDQLRVYYKTRSPESKNQIESFMLKRKEDGTYTHPEWPPHVKLATVEDLRQIRNNPQTGSLINFTMPCLAKATDDERFAAALSYMV